MCQFIGRKESFGVEIEVTKMTPSLWGKTALWLNGIKIGHFEDEDVLGPFINSIGRLVTESNTLWEPEFKGLNCQEIFYRITPFYNEDLSKFWTLTEVEQDALVSFDKYLFGWGENFDDWTLRVVVDNEVCKFMYVYTPNRDADSYEVRNNIQCFNVYKNEVQLVYAEICKLIPEPYWLRMIKRI